jgi:hypothetical protein
VKPETDLSRRQFLTAAAAPVLAGPALPDIDERLRQQAAKASLARRFRGERQGAGKTPPGWILAVAHQRDRSPPAGYFQSSGPARAWQERRERFSPRRHFFLCFCSAL